MTLPRTFLFLQGPVGVFFSRLAQQLVQRGHRIRRVHFNGGDRAAWHAGHAVDYRGGVEDWAAFLDTHFAEHGITDLILFGDCRPLHRTAIESARAKGIAVHVFEEGYLRPNWITLESGGVNRFSSLPRDPQRYRDLGRLTPDTDAGATSRNAGFASRALADVAYNLASLLLAWRYPRYVTHKPWHPLAEYRHGAPRFIAGPLRRRRNAREVASLLASGKPYFVFPLQLDGDAQIRFHSPYGRMQPAIEEVIRSFAQHAPPETLLAISEHPMDWGVSDLAPGVKTAAAAQGVAGRVIFLECGSPEPLLRGSRGVVTVNSTVGFLALGMGVPVRALAQPIYDLAGLCCQAPLAEFWRHATPPDAELFASFRRVVIAQSQIRGGFYDDEAIALAVANAAARLSDMARAPADAVSALRQAVPG